MSKSQRLRLRDVRDVFRLMGECRELGADSVAWREHLFASLRPLVGAQVAIGGEALRLWEGPPELVQTVDLGWEGDRERAAWLGYARQGLAVCPIYNAMRRLTGRLRTRLRRQVIDDREWYRSFSFNEFHRESRVDRWLASFYTLADGPDSRTNGIMLHRALGEPPFSHRDWRLVHLLHAELGPLIGRQLASARESSAAGLAPRARETLACLLEGDSSKQIARRLKISPETVNQYIKSIYRHFGVNSRAELLVRWMRRSRGSP